MSKPDRHLALLLGSDRVVAVQSELAPGGSGNLAVHVWPVPPETPQSDSGLYGDWLRGCFDRSGLRGRRCVLALDRADVLVKRLVFAALPADLSDLTSMVGLQVARQIVAPPGGLRVDYLRSEKPNDPSVLAAAVPNERLETAMRAARAAGLTVQRVAPLSCGYAAVARAAARGGDGARLIIASTPPGTEFIVVDSGEVMLSRWVATPTAEAGPDASGSRWIALEARRTLMSHSADAGARPVAACAVVGSTETAGGIAAIVTEITGLSCDVIGSENGAEGDASAIGLTGLFAEARSDLAVIDLAHPRKAQDRAARRRQFAMAAVLGLIVAVGGVFTLGSRNLSDAEAQLNAIKDLHAEETAARLTAMRDVARLDHILKWEESSPDWLAHFATIGEVAPPGEGVVRELRGSASRNSLTYSKKGGTYDPNSWAVDPSVSLLVKGIAKSTDAAERYRGAFVDDARYTVFPAGQDGLPAKDPEYPIAFGLDLQSGGVTRVLRSGGNR